VVKVISGTAVAQKCGHEPITTNQRMELTALIEAYKMVALDEEVTVYTDSQYAKKIAMDWGAVWKSNAWGRGKKQKPIKNLDLVQELYDLVQSHPKVRVEWQKGHGGCRWNEYADSLSTAYTRDRV
jgi:ribonuclease HI